MELVAGTTRIDDLDAFLDELHAIGDATGCVVQAFDARYLTGPDHLRHAACCATRAFDRGENVARDPAVELLLYAAGRRQIDRALEIGVGEGTTPAVVCVLDRTGFGGENEHAEDETGENGNDPSIEIDSPATDAERAAARRVIETMGDGQRVDPTGASFDATDPERVRSFFEISEREERATDGTLADLTIERVALLDVRK